jgi:hypothetical protein
MPNPRPLLLLVASLAFVNNSSAAAQSKPPLEAVPATSPKSTPQKLTEVPEIVFYVAKGDANACGHGCSEWIAGDGKIDGGAPQRLRKLLAKLGARKLPLFFHSPGGVVDAAIELGRLMRSQKMTLGVAHTIPQGCDRDKLNGKSCEALKRSGQDLASEFDTSTTMCNSSCVYALAAGTTRIIPPFGGLGIHSVGIESNGHTPIGGAALATTRRMVNSRILEYLRDMGIDAALLTAANAVPFSSARFLQRDEFARFGIDARDFGETGWSFMEKPAVAMIKTYFVRTKLRMSNSPIMTR